MGMGMGMGVDASIDDEQARADDTDVDEVNRSSLHDRAVQLFRTPRGRRRLIDLSLLTGAAVYVVALLVYRVDGLPMTKTIWAEDGTLFISDAYADDSVSGWFREYAGYLHVLPRALSSIIVQLPPEQIPFWLALSSAVVSAGCLLLLAHGLRPWLPEAWMQAAFVVSVGSARNLSSEIAANVANLHWFATLGLIGLVLIRPKSWWTSGLLAVVALALGLSDAFAILIAPFAAVVLLYRFARERSDVAMLRTVPIAVAVGFGGLAQFVLQSRRPRGEPTIPPKSWDETLEHWIFDVVGDAITFPEMTGLEIGLQTLLVLVLVAVGVLAGRAALLGKDGPAVHLVVAASLAAASFFFLAMSVQVNHAYGNRYGALPAALLVAAAVVAVGGTTWVNRLLIASVTVGMLGAVLISGGIVHPTRGASPDITVEIEKARDECERTGDDEVLVPTAPAHLDERGDWDTDWFMTLPCSELTTVDLRRGTRIDRAD